MKDWPDNSEALLELSADGGRSRPEANFWCVSDAFEGVQVFGGTGSGKSSGSGQALARAFLESNFGGLVLTAKNDEAGQWREYAKACGRERDLIEVSADSKYRFNFLEYELNRPGVGAGHTENLVNLFCSVLEAAERKQGGGGGNDAYWQRTLRQLLRNAIDLLIIATDTLDLKSLYRVITSAPNTLAEAKNEEWQEGSVCFRLIEVGEEKAVKSDREEDFELTRDYWLKEFPGLAQETRSVIVSIFTSMADCFLRGLLRKLFCSELNFRPEDSFDGKIIVIDLPVKEFNELGQFSQVLFKFIWQRAVERRVSPDMKRKEGERSVRPVFLWADESQFFVNSYDALFQSTARSSRACTIYLTQNLPSYFAAFGGMNGKNSTEAFLGNLQTKIFHANGDPTTNEWAAQSIGRTQQIQLSGGLSEGYSQGGNLSAGGQLQYQFLIQPQEFTMLQTGGPDFGFEVDSVVFQGGRGWEGIGRKCEKKRVNFIRPLFPQQYEEESE